MTLTILKMHMKLAQRFLTSRDDQRVFLLPLFFLGMVLLSLIAFLLSAVIFDGFEKQLPGAAIVHFPSLVFLIAFIVLLYTSINKAFKNLFTIDDFSFFRSSPVKPTDFFIAKFFSIWLESSWAPTVVIIPIGFGYGYTLSNWLTYDISFLLAYISFSIMITLFGVAIVLNVVKSISVAKFNEFLVALRILPIVVALWIFPFGVPGRAPEALSKTAATKAVNMFFDNIRFIFLPGTWIDSFLSITEKGRLVGLFWLFPLFALTALTASLILYQYQYVFQNLSANSSVGRQPRLRKRRISPYKLTGIVKKDFLSWQRSIALKIQTTAAAVVAVMLAIKFLKGIVSGASLGSDKTLLSLVVGILMGTMITSRLSIGSLSTEGRCLWLILSSPTSTRRLLGSKLLSGWLPMFVVSMISGTIIAMFFLTPLHKMFWLFAKLAAVTATISAMGIASGSAFPNFEWTDTNPAPSNIAGLAFSVSFILYITLVCFIDRLRNEFVVVAALLLLLLITLRFCENLIDQMKLSYDA